MDGLPILLVIFILYWVDLISGVPEEEDPESEIEKRQGIEL